MGIYTELVNEELHSFDVYPNNNLLTEAGLSRIIQKVKDDKKDFATLSAYRKKFDKNENIKRNRDLRYEFDKRKMGVYLLVGHWQECQIDGVDYKDCPKNKLVDSIERSYLVVRPTDMSQDEFKDLILDLVQKYNQDAAIISLEGVISVLNNNGRLDRIGTDTTIGKISQAYSQHVRKMNTPFVFECEVPGSNSGMMVFSRNNILYPVGCKREELREWKDFSS